MIVDGATSSDTPACCTLDRFIAVACQSAGTVGGSILRWVGRAYGMFYQMASEDLILVIDTLSENPESQFMSHGIASRRWGSSIHT